MFKLRSPHSIVATLAATVAFLSCTNTTDPGCEAVSVTLQPSPLVLSAIGATGQLEASVSGAGGCSVSNPSVSWTSNAATVATVSGDGLVTAVGNGTAMITASAGTGSVSATVNVQQTAARMERVAGDGQTGLLNGAVGIAPAVRVFDANDNLAEGVEVSFVVTAGNGTVESGEVESDAAGVATVGAWIMGPEVGTDNNTLEARIGGLTALTFTASAELGAAEALVIATGNGQSATVGTALAEAPTAKVADAAGNGIAGHTVAFEVVDGGGTITGVSVVTGDDGLAAVGSWTLGTVAGEEHNRMRASSDGFDPVMFVARATPDVPAAAGVHAGNEQTGVVGTAVATPPAVVVSDQYGNPIPDLAVTFGVTAGGGTVNGPSAITNGEGVAAVAGWVLGTVSGSGNNTLTATLGGLPAVTFTASAAAGAVVSMVMGDGNAQEAAVNAAVAVPPSVVLEDRFANPVPDVTVVFNVEAGGGSITDDRPLTDDNGVATVGSWTLGTTAGGANQLAARVDGLSTVIRFTATPRAGAAATITIIEGAGQSGVVGAPLGVAPAVRVHDEFVNPVPGVAVTFTPGAGSGTVTGGETVTDASGMARVGSWNLGSNGANVLNVSVGGLPPAVVQATGVVSTFDIEIRYMAGTDPTQAQRDIIQSAADRWRAVITADVGDVTVTVADGQCFNLPALSETVDDVLVYVEYTGIDDAFGTLATGGTCWVRMDPVGRVEHFLPILGRIRLDTDDLDRLESNGDLEKVLVHEFGHVLGIGTIWDDLELLADTGGADPYYTGVAGRAAFEDIGGSDYTGRKVPIANTGGSGTRLSHWRESVFDTELMTGFIDNGPTPMSIVTAAALADFGYSVNLAAADDFLLPGSTFAAARDVTIQIPLGEDVDTGPLFGVDRFGRVWRIR